MKKTYVAKGKTREEAIDAGLEALDLTIDEVTVEDVEEGSKGLFGLFGSRPWTVRITAIEDDEVSEVLDTHSLFANSLDEKPVKKQAAEKQQPAEKKEGKEARSQEAG